MGGGRLIELKAAIGLEQKIEELERYKRDVDLGNVEVDDIENEKDSVEEDIAKAKNGKMEILETELFAERMEMLLKGEDPKTYKNVLRVIASRMDEIKEEMPDLALFAQAVHLAEKVTE